MLREKGTSQGCRSSCQSMSTLPRYRSFTYDSECYRAPSCVAMVLHWSINVTAPVLFHSISGTVVLYFTRLDVEVWDCGGGSLQEKS